MVETETEIEGNKKTKGWMRGWKWRKKYRQKTREKKMESRGGLVKQEPRQRCPLSSDSTPQNINTHHHGGSMTRRSQTNQPIA